jgi:hypothetical protein
MIKLTLIQRIDQHNDGILDSLEGWHQNLAKSAGWIPQLGN